MSNANFKFEQSVKITMVYDIDSAKELVRTSANRVIAKRKFLEQLVDQAELHSIEHQLDQFQLEAYRSAKEVTIECSAPMCFLKHIFGAVRYPVPGGQSRVTPELKEKIRHYAILIYFNNESDAEFKNLANTMRLKWPERLVDPGCFTPAGEEFLDAAEYTLLPTVTRDKATSTIAVSGVVPETTMLGIIRRCTKFGTEFSLDDAFDSDIRIYIHNAIASGFIKSRQVDHVKFYIHLPYYEEFADAECYKHDKYVCHDVVINNVTIHVEYRVTKLGNIRK